MKDLAIECKTSSEKMAAFALLYGFGMKYDDCDDLATCISTYDDDVTNMRWPKVLVIWNPDEKEYYIDLADSTFRHGGLDHKFTQLKPIMDFLNSKTSATVKISKDYEAVVTKKGIQVGCQSISFADFDKLVEAVATIR